MGPLVSATGPRPPALAAAVVLAAGISLAAWGQAPARAAEAPPPPGLPGAPEEPFGEPRQAPPAVDMALPAEGTRLVYRTTDGSGRESIDAWTVLADGDYHGRPVARLGNGVETRLFDRASRNWLATLKDGREVEAVEPHQGIWSWPLRVGNRWRAEFVYHDLAHGVTVGPIGTEWTVEDFEPVEVPAGTFAAMRLRGEPGRNNTRRMLLWYAPELGVVVRRVDEQPGAGGRRQQVTELVEYKAP